MGIMMKKILPVVKKHKNSLIYITKQEGLEVMLLT